MEPVVIPFGLGRSFYGKVRTDAMRKKLVTGAPVRAEFSERDKRAEARIVPADGGRSKAI